MTAATLRRLVEQGTIDPTTPIRRGEDGPWFPAERIHDVLVPVAEVEPVEVSGGKAVASREPGAVPGDELAEWHFSREDQRKLGPVPRSVMLAMAAQGKLKPTDLVWKPGMASWVPAAERPELTGAFPAAPVESESRRKSRPARPSARLSRAIVAAGIALLALMTTALWTWMRIDPGRAGVYRAERPADARPVPGSTRTTPAGVGPAAAATGR